MAALITHGTSELAALDWAVAGSALDGEASGDLHLVLPGSPRTLISVMDGLGHGLDARHASIECARVLEAHAGEALLSLVELCHAGLRDTRGIALTLGLLDAARGELEWLAVGNVEGLVLRDGLPRGLTHDAVIQRGGVVGYRLPPLKLSRVQLLPQDLIVLATDGIRAGFTDDLDMQADVRDIASGISQRFGRASDDRLVLVARYGPGGTP